MKTYRKPSGVHITVHDHIPVANHLEEIANPPSPDHVIVEYFDSLPPRDRLDPDLCWRPKTAQELDADKTARAEERLNDPVIESIIEAIPGLNKQQVVNVLKAKM